jgi:hypothetical protein
VRELIEDAESIAASAPVDRDAVEIEGAPTEAGRGEPVERVPQKRGWRLGRRLAPGSERT